MAAQASNVRRAGTRMEFFLISKSMEIKFQGRTLRQTEIQFDMHADFFATYPSPLTEGRIVWKFLHAKKEASYQISAR